MDLPPSKKLLEPVSWIYKGIVMGRNALYNNGILKRTEHDIPVICIGNITVGGTGKTPHIEYLIQLLSTKYKVAVLSRGYKRRTRGFREVYIDNTVSEVGDEPLQIKQKYPHVSVFVDGNRNRAIYKMLERPIDIRPDVVLLDDGYQHLSTKPSLSILLMDSNRPIYEDKFLPSGRLREPFSARMRANMVIVTKCSDALQPLDFRLFEKNLDLYPFQSLIFTSLQYGDLKPVFPDLAEEGRIYLNDLRKKHVILVTGIAAPQTLIQKLERITYNLYTIEFPDHHDFKSSDIEKIKNKINQIKDEEGTLIVTTEKDAKRLQSNKYLNEELKKIMYFIPVNVKFIESEEQEMFNNNIFDHVRNYKRNK